MRVVQKEGRPQSLFLVAETEADEVLIAALRMHGRVMVHSILEDEDYEDLVVDPAHEQADGKALEAALSGRSHYDATCYRHAEPDRGMPERACPQCRTAVEMDVLRRVAELEIAVPCACGADPEPGPQFDDATGHHKDCLVPRADALGLKVRT